MTLPELIRRSLRTLNADATECGPVTGWTNLLTRGAGRVRHAKAHEVHDGLISTFSVRPRCDRLYRRRSRFHEAHRTSTGRPRIRPLGVPGHWKESAPEMPALAPQLIVSWRGGPNGDGSEQQMIVAPPPLVEHH